MTDWQQALRELVRDPAHLLELTGLETAGLELAGAGQAAFPLKAPAAFVNRIRRHAPDDPLLRQILPLAEEDREAPGFSRDPVGENARHAAPGLIRKYPGRVLLVTTAACAIHCRYCFRRHYPYQDNNPGRENWTAALESIRADQSIREVILSGGDPLSLADNKLASLIRGLENIPHLQWLRIHTRMPVVLPARVTPGLLDAITANRFRQTMVVHCNHPDEIDADAEAALQALHAKGVQLLNQAVLLRGVNDDAAILASLSERLHASRVLPYYLHMLDPVAGAAHFEVADSTATAIMRALRAILPGYLVPRLVRETAGEPNKTVIA